MTPLVQRLQRCLNGCRFFSPQSTVVVAVSTGVDSMVLLTALQKLLPATQIVVAHVNHHLRSQSKIEEEYLREYCHTHHLQLMVDEWVDHPDHGIEAAAREERYRFFAHVLRVAHANILLLAHQRDELVETMLMQLLRGGRIDQLMGISSKRQFENGQLTILRPWLDVTKQELIAFAKEHQVRWYEDSTNQEDETLRNRFRNHYIPAMMKENERFKDHCIDYRAQLEDLLAIRDEYLQVIWEKVVQKDQLQITVWQSLSTALRRAVLVKWLDQRGAFQVNTEMLANLTDWLTNSKKPSGRMQICHQKQFIKNYSTAKIENVPKLVMNSEPFAETVVKFDQWKRLNEENECLISHNKQIEGLVPVAEMWLQKDQLPLKWRLVHDHDRLRLKGGNHQSVRRLLINSKLSRSKRNDVMVLADHQDEVLWVPPLKTAWLDRTPFAHQSPIVTYLYRRKRKQK